jgi:hypothetical protein
MIFDKNEIIGKLRLELEILEGGGYSTSIEKPHWSPRIFRDSISCPNLGLEFKVEPCSECFLTYFVPPENRGKENACHHIPLNDRGDTVASLSEIGDDLQLQNALRTWLQNTITRLAKEPDMHLDEQPLLSAANGRRSEGITNK